MNVKADQPSFKAHPFEQFKSAMRKVVSVSKTELDANLKAHNEQKQERRAVSKTRRPKSD